MSPEPESSRIQIAALLGDIGASGSFSTRRTAPPDLLIEVKDVGQLQIPIGGEQAGALRRIARPARYGLREQTLVDRLFGIPGKSLVAG